MTNAAALFMDAGSLGFPSGCFDLAICGFMGWSDSFDFAQGAFKKPDSRAAEIHRVLRETGRFVCCAWERQEDLDLMEEAMLRHYPALLEDPEYLAQRPLGAVYEAPEGYEIILGSAGFRRFGFARETLTAVSTDEEEWWRQMLALDWRPFVDKIGAEESEPRRRLQEAVFGELRGHRRPGGIHFDKTVLFVWGVK